MPAGMAPAGKETAKIADRVFVLAHELPTGLFDAGQEGFTGMVAGSLGGACLKAARIDRPRCVLREATFRRTPLPDS